MTGRQGSRGRVPGRLRSRLADLERVCEQLLAGVLFLDRSGRIRYIQIGEGAYPGQEQMIHALLAEAAPSALGTVHAVRGANYCDVANGAVILTVGGV